jgi:hypothetical protein
MHHDVAPRIPAGTTIIDPAGANALRFSVLQGENLMQRAGFPAGMIFFASIVSGTWAQVPQAPPYPAADDRWAQTLRVDHRSVNAQLDAMAELKVALVRTDYTGLLRFLNLSIVPQNRELKASSRRVRSNLLQGKCACGEP